MGSFLSNFLLLLIVGATLHIKFHIKVPNALSVNLFMFYTKGTEGNSCVICV